MPRPRTTSAVAEALGISRKQLIGLGGVDYLASLAASEIYVLVNSIKRETGK